MYFDIYGNGAPEGANTYKFYGINRLRRAGRGEFSQMRNMSSLEYPCAAPRKCREAVVLKDNIQAVCTPDSEKVPDITAFTGVAGNGFYYNGVLKSRGYDFSSDYKWSIVRMGNEYIINGYNKNAANLYKSIMYRYNSDTDEFGLSTKMMDDLIVSSGTDKNGNYLVTFRYGYDEVRDYKVTDDDGNVVVDNEDFFIKYGQSMGSVLPSSNIFEQVFSIGEEVNIDGFPKRSENIGQVWTYETSAERVLPQTAQDFSYNNTYDTDVISDINELDRYMITSAVIKSFNVQKYYISGKTVYIHYVYFTLLNKDGDELDFDDMDLGGIRAYCSGVKLTKKTRQFDNITSHHNRIWGTNPTGNMIYASASDKKYSFSPADIVSGYAARLVSDTSGVFKGICEYGTEVIAFKEDSISVIYGSNSLNYSISVIGGIGCIDGNSIAVTPSGVIFLSYNGFYIYSGGAPRCISSKLNTSYLNAVSGFDGVRYYACAKNENVTELLVYNMQYGTWHIHDDIDAVGFFRHRNDFYLATKNTVYRLNSGGDEVVNWSFTSTRLYDNTFFNKAICEIWIRAEVEDGAEFCIETSIDDGEFVKHGVFNKSGLNVFRCPVRLVMGNSYRYRISGRGDVVFYEIELVRAGGGRRYKEYGGD